MFDPSIPARDLDLLRRQGTRLVPAGRPFPPWPRFSPPILKLLVKDLFGLQLLAFFALVGLLLLVTVTLGEGAASAVPYVIAAADLGTAGWLVRCALSEPPGHRAARIHHGRYYTAEDFDDDAADLLGRAQRAVETVLQAESSRRGLLDTVDNAVTLPRVLWEIADTVRAQTVLRAEQREAASGVMTPELHAVLVPQRAALARSVASVVERVDRLETYARRVMEADAAYRARHLMDSNDKYRELLARTHDETALAGLSDRARALEETLARSVREAIDTGRTLAL